MRLHIDEKLKQLSFLFHSLIYSFFYFDSQNLRNSSAEIEEKIEKERANHIKRKERNEY